MTSQRSVWVALRDDHLSLVPGRDRWGPCFAFPDSPGGGSVFLSPAEAVHARIHPLGTAERVLASWARGELREHWAPADDPTEPPPSARRGAAVVLADGRLLAIRYPPQTGRRYFIPGGGVEPDETPKQAAVRELHEETGLTGAAVRELATVYNRGREEHYFLVQADAPGRARPLDLADGETLEWIDVAALPGTPIWPKRLAWRITHWYAHAWPDPIAVLADSSGDLHTPCVW